MSCLNCGERAAPGDAFCAVCGHPIVQETSSVRAVQDDVEPIVCDFCQTSNHPDSSYCAGCGTELIFLCQKCGETSWSSTEFCRQCGNRLQEVFDSVELGGRQGRLMIGPQKLHFVPDDKDEDIRAVRFLLADLVDVRARPGDGNVLLLTRDQGIKVKVPDRVLLINFLRDAAGLPSDPTATSAPRGMKPYVTFTLSITWALYGFALIYQLSKGAEGLAPLPLLTSIAGAVVIPSAALIVIWLALKGRDSWRMASVADQRTSHVHGVERILHIGGIALVLAAVVYLIRTFWNPRAALSASLLLLLVGLFAIYAEMATTRAERLAFAGLVLRLSGTVVAIGLEGLRHLLLLTFEVGPRDATVLSIETDVFNALPWATLATDLGLVISAVAILSSGSIWRWSAIGLAWTGIASALTVLNVFDSPVPFRTSAFIALSLLGVLMLRDANRKRSERLHGFQPASLP